MTAHHVGLRRLVAVVVLTFGLLPGLAYAASSQIAGGSQKALITVSFFKGGTGTFVGTFAGQQLNGKLEPPSKATRKFCAATKGASGPGMSLGGTYTNGALLLQGCDTSTAIVQYTVAGKFDQTKVIGSAIFGVPSAGAQATSGIFTGMFQGKVGSQPALGTFAVKQGAKPNQLVITALFKVT